MRFQSSSDNVHVCTRTKAHTPAHTPLMHEKLGTSSLVMFTEDTLHSQPSSCRLCGYCLWQHVQINDDLQKVHASMAVSQLCNTSAICLTTVPNA